MLNIKIPWLCVFCCVSEFESSVESSRSYNSPQHLQPSAPPRKPPQKLLNGSSSKSTAEVVALNAVPQTSLLDTSANKSKAYLANSGALAARRPPSRKSSGVRGPHECQCMIHGTPTNTEEQEIKPKHTCPPSCITCYPRLKTHEKPIPTIKIIHSE